MQISAAPLPLNKYRISKADEAILRVINRFHYMTAAQISRLLYPNCNDNNRYSQRRLRVLNENGYLLRLRELPTPRYGSAPHIFTLSQKGRKYITSLGISVPYYFRPSEEKEKAFNNPFIEHTLQTIDILIAAHSLCRQYKVTCPDMLSERELKHQVVRVKIPGSFNGQSEKSVAVIPDAWFQLKVKGSPTVSIALELDRGTEEQKRWKAKVTALAYWAMGPYREAFNTDNLTIAVVAPSAFRRDKLRYWTATELEKRNLEQLLQVFIFTDVSPVEKNPYEFFFNPVWFLSKAMEPVSLLDQPSGLEEVFHAFP